MGSGRKRTRGKAGDRQPEAECDDNDTCTDTKRKCSPKIVSAKRKEKTRVNPIKMIDLSNVSMSESEKDEVEKKYTSRRSSDKDAARRGRSGKKPVSRSSSVSSGSAESEPLPSSNIIITTPVATSKPKGKRRTRIRSREDVTSKSSPSNKKSKMSEERSRKHETRPILEIFSMNDSKLKELQSPDYDGDDQPPCWRFDTSKLFGRDMSNGHMCKFTNFATKFSDHVDYLLWKDSPVSDMKEYDSIRDPIRPLLYFASNLKEITLTDAAPLVLAEFVMRMAAAKQHGCLKNLEAFKIQSVLGGYWLDDVEMEMLALSKIRWREVQITDCTIRQTECNSLERLLKANEACLKSFEFCVGCPIKLEAPGPQLEVVVPKMQKLEHLCIRVQFSGKDGDELVNDVKPFRRSDWASKDVPQNMTNFVINLKKLKLTLPPDLPQLKSLVLGNGVEVGKLTFSLVKRLETFHCGGQWHLTTKFPTEDNQSAFRDSRVTSLQLPDDLRDPSYVKKFAKYFPNVRKLTVNLPSVAVLRSIFLHFGPAKLEELTLRTQYDFDTVLDSALFPHLQLTPNKATQKEVKTLKAYKFAKQFIESRKVELPGQAVDPTTKGIDSLKKLKRLHLQHIPRRLQIPLNGNGKRPEHMGEQFLTCSSSQDSRLSKKTYERLLQLVDRDHLTFEGITISVICSSDSDGTDEDEDEDPISGVSASSSSED